MKRLRTVVTAHSVWKFDVLMSRYLRFPREDAPGPDALIPYSAGWEPYLGLERQGNRIVVHRPVPMGEGALRMTGRVEWRDLAPDEYDFAPN